MSRVIDYLPYVLEALENKTLNQTALTEAVWGTSGRNNPRLVNLLDYMVRKGLIIRTCVGRAKYYSAAVDPAKVGK